MKGGDLYISRRRRVSALFLCPKALNYAETPAEQLTRETPLKLMEQGRHPIN